MSTWIESKDNALKAESLGDLAAAEKHWLQVIARLRSEPEQKKSLCSALERLGQVYLRDHRPHLATDVLSQSLNVKVKELGHLHLAVGHVQNELAKAHFQANNLEEAATLATKCLKCFESGYGDESLEIATVALNLAMTYHLGGLFAEAEPHYKRALTIRTKKLGATDPQTAKVLQNYAKLLRQMHREGEADHLDRCAFGSITGTWKALVIPEDQAVTQEQGCSFCGASLDGAPKCSKCGTAA